MVSSTRSAADSSTAVSAPAAAGTSPIAATSNPVHHRLVVLFMRARLPFLGCRVLGQAGATRTLDRRLWCARQL